MDRGLDARLDARLNARPKEVQQRYLTIVLERRFGPLSDAQSAKILAARSAQLDRLYLQALKGKTVQELLG